MNSSIIRFQSTKIRRESDQVKRYRFGSRGVGSHQLQYDSHWVVLENSPHFSLVCFTKCFHILKEKICSIRSSVNPASGQFCDLVTGPAPNQATLCFPQTKVGVGSRATARSGFRCVEAGALHHCTTWHVPGRPSSLVDFSVLSKLG